jgi:ketosteroid isomerase-like protein
MTIHSQPIRCSLIPSVITAVVAVVILFACFDSQTAFANPQPEKKHDAKRQVEALEEQWRVAQLAADTGTMEKMLSDDYLGISMTGEVDTKMQQLRRMADRRLMLTKIELNDMKVKLIGAIAIVTSQAKVEGTNDGASVRGTYRYTRIYRHLPSGQWKITSFEATREREHKGHVDAQEEEPARGGSVQPISETK